MATALIRDTAIYRRLLSRARPYAVPIVAIFAIGLLASPIALLTPLPLKIVVDSVIGSDARPGGLQALRPDAVLGSSGEPGRVVAVTDEAVVRHRSSFRHLVAVVAASRLGSGRHLGCRPQVAGLLRATLDAGSS